MAELAPSGLQAKVRNLQVHGRDADTAYAGQRVAVNLAGLKKSEVQRGDTVVCPGTIRCTRMLDVRLENLKSSQRVILDGSQVHLYHGSSVLLAKTVLLDRDQLEPGASCYAQLRLTEEIAAKNGDRFVVRFYSPLETIGGGVILDETPLRHKRKDPGVLEALKIKESGSGDEKLVQTIATFRYGLPTDDQLCRQLQLEEVELSRQLSELCGRGAVLALLPGRYLAASVLDSCWEDCRKLLEAYHQANPLHAGMKLAELRQKLLPGVDLSVADAMLDELEREGRIRRVADRYALQDFAVKLTKRQTAIRDRLLKIYRDAGLETPSLDELYPLFLPKEKEDCKQVLESLVSGGELVLLSPQILYHGETYARVYEQARLFFDTHTEMTLAEFRDLLGTSRKYALAILEYFDRNKLTKKDGDLRRPGAGF